MSHALAAALSVAAAIPRAPTENLKRTLTRRLLKQLRELTQGRSPGRQSRLV